MFFPECETLDTKPIRHTLVPVRGKEPAFIVLVNRLDEEAETEISRELTTAILKAQGATDTPDVVEAQAARKTAFVEKVWAGWENATPANLDYLLARNNKKIGPNMRKSIEEAGGAVPFSVELAVWLIDNCRSTDVDNVISRVARFGAQQKAAELEGKDASSPKS